MKRCLLIFFILLTLSGNSWAHEMRPGYMEVTEITAGAYNVLWKVPMKGKLRLKLDPVFPESCKDMTTPVVSTVAAAQLTNRTIRCPAGLVDKSISINGLSSTLTDVLVRLKHLNGEVQTVRLQPSEPTFIVVGSPGKLSVAGTYLLLGIDHILLGIDHLLFVFALLLLISGVRRLVWAITAFTVAHSITLAGASLGYVYVSGPPVEAVIALSILFLAVELVKHQQGKSDFAMRSPWVVAFVFGLLHGFGFAGALAETGLPQTEIPLALLMFNIGVEVGQLMFIATVLVSMMLWKKLVKLELLWLPRFTAYVIGSVSSFWIFSRISTF